MSWYKRYKVVRDARGVWGIVDTVRAEARVNLAFAPYSREAHQWINIIAVTASHLNSEPTNRNSLYWEQYEPRKNNKNGE